MQLLKQDYMVKFIGSVGMTSKYIEEHLTELDSIARYYEQYYKDHKDQAIKYRAECIRELIKWENLKLK